MSNFLASLKGWCRTAGTRKKARYIERAAAVSLYVELEQCARMWNEAMKLHSILLKDNDIVALENAARTLYNSSKEMNRILVKIDKD